MPVHTRPVPVKPIRGVRSEAPQAADLPHSTCQGAELPSLLEQLYTCTCRVMPLKLLCG